MVRLVILASSHIYFKKNQPATHSLDSPLRSSSSVAFVDICVVTPDFGRSARAACIYFCLEAEKNIK